MSTVTHNSMQKFCSLIRLDNSVGNVRRLRVQEVCGLIPGDRVQR